LTARASTPVPFLEVAREAAAETSQAFAQRLLNWHFAEPDQFLPVPRLALRQVLVLLLRNSVQATPRDATPSLQLGAQVHAAGWEFWVADQGRGFTAEQRAALEEFLAGRAAVPGKGFGLLFVTQVAASWGARLHVTSEPGRGCIVTVLGAH
jgi:signal transduction histidine kinase